MIRGENLLGDLLERVSVAGRALTGARAAEPVGAQCEALLGGSGEATGLALAASILERYAGMDATERLAFFRMLASRFGVDLARLDTALTAWRSGDAPDARALHFAAEPRSQELIRRLNRAPNGARALVAMRADLLSLLPDAPELAPLDDDFRHLFSSWFNRGFLELRRIDWNAPAAILEKIIAHEAVHEINGWDDLRRRVAAPDRRLYGFFHPALRDDPLIFVEVALTKDIPDAIGPILAEDRAALDPAESSVAAFYSISNCQAGLRGVSFGNFLIKQVVEELRAEAPGLRQFATLSPIPGLRRWALSTDALEGALGDTVAALEAGADVDPSEAAALGAVYLMRAKARSGGPLDPVARFHLGNGARLERINPEADASERGRAAAWGMMVNYLYDLPAIEKNHEAFAATGEIAASAAVRRVLRTRLKEAEHV